MVLDKVAANNQSAVSSGLLSWYLWWLHGKNTFSRGKGDKAFGLKPRRLLHSHPSQSARRKEGINLLPYCRSPFQKCLAYLHSWHCVDYLQVLLKALLKSRIVHLVPAKGLSSRKSNIYRCLSSEALRSLSYRFTLSPQRRKPAQNEYLSRNDKLHV